MRVAVGVAIIAIVSAVPALYPLASQAEAVAFSCTFVGPASEAQTRDALMDHLLVDAAKNRVELQVANSMGTSKEVNWTMVDRAVVQTDRFSVVQGEGDNFVGTGTNLGNPTIITFKNGLLRWLTFNDNGIKTTETTYLCRR